MDSRRKFRLLLGHARQPEWARGQTLARLATLIHPQPRAAYARYRAARAKVVRPPLGTGRANRRSSP